MQLAKMNVHGSTLAAKVTMVETLRSLLSDLSRSGELGTEAKKEIYAFF